MEMFSKELYELDKNTVQYMMDEMQDTIDAQKKELGEQQAEIDAQKEKLGKQQDTIDRIEQEKEKIWKEKEKIERENEEIKKKQQAERENTIIGTINFLRDMNMPEEEIIRRICGLYQFDEEQVEKYL